jgi:hypothetical protein
MKPFGCITSGRLGGTPVPPTPHAVRLNKLEYEATTKEPQVASMLGVLFCGNEKELNVDGAVALRTVWEAFLRGKVGRVSALRSSLHGASTQRRR